MKAVPFTDQNVVYTLEGGTAANNLPAARGVDPKDKPVVETHWQPTAEERDAIAAGGDIILHVWTSAEYVIPPLGMLAGEPTGEVHALPTGHIAAAIGFLHAALEQRLDLQQLTDAAIDTDAVLPEPEDFFGLWIKAVHATAGWREQAEIATALTAQHDEPAGIPIDPRLDGDTTAYVCERCGSPADPPHFLRVNTPVRTDVETICGACKLADDTQHGA